jgi:TolB-like protein/DNA-binding SARP family transcriptional activator
MSRPRVTLFGGFAARGADGAVLPLPTRKAQALLAVLACGLGKPQPRDRLTALLWGERGDAQARHSLSQTLTTIRHAFGGAGPLLVDREAIALDIEALEIDVIVLERLAGSDAVTDLSAAAALYRGPFLEGLSLREPALEEWLTQERSRFHGLASATLLNLARQQAAVGETEAAEAALGRALVLDPLSEEAHRRLIGLHLDQRSYNAAIRQYRACAEILRRELASAPEPSTTALYSEATRRLQSAMEESRDASTGMAAGDPTSGGHGAPPDGSARPSVAVVPFANLSGDPGQTYFSDGITEDVITELSRFRELFVVARHSSFRYRDEAADVTRVARELGVRFIVRGGVRRAGERARITVQLVDATKGTQIWADRFDLDIGEVFAVQDEVVQTIVATVAGHLELEEGKRARRKRADNLAAYDCYLRGMEHVHNDERAALEQARQWFERALEIEADYPAPMAMLAIIAVLEGFYAPSDEHLERARQLAERATVLDPNDSWAHCARGYINLKRRSYDLAAEDLDEAMRLNPNEPDHIAFRALHHVFTGSAESALQLLQRAERLNPYVPHWYRAHRGYALYSQRRYAEAAQSFERQLPRPYWDTCFLAACYARLGRSADARARMAEALQQMPGLSLDLFAARMPYAEPAALAHLLDGLRGAGLRAPAARG